MRLPISCYIPGVLRRRLNKHGMAFSSVSLISRLTSNYRLINLFLLSSFLRKARALNSVTISGDGVCLGEVGDEYRQGVTPPSTWPCAGTSDREQPSKHTARHMCFRQYLKGQRFSASNRRHLTSIRYFSALWRRLKDHLLFGTALEIQFRFSKKPAAVHKARYIIGHIQKRVFSRKMLTQ